MQAWHPGMQAYKFESRGEWLAPTDPAGRRSMIETFMWGYWGWGGSMRELARA